MRKSKSRGPDRKSDLLISLICFLILRITRKHTRKVNTRAINLYWLVKYLIYFLPHNSNYENSIDQTLMHIILRVRFQAVHCQNKAITVTYYKLIEFTKYIKNDCINSAHF